MIWIEFILSAWLIVIAGTKLVRYADLLSDKLSISKVWVGIILLGLVTSLPEAITSLVAVISFEATDLAVGNMLGSNVYNLMIVVIMDALYRQGSITNQFKVNSSNNLSALFAVILSVIVAFEIFLSSKMSLIKINHISLGCILIAVVYLLSIKILFHTGAQKSAVLTNQSRHNIQDVGVSKISMNLLISAILVIIGAIGLTYSCEVIARSTGLGRMFVGSIFLALATTLPEIVVSLSALKIGSFDLAIGNIFGSNMINIFIIFACSIFYFKGPILGSVSQTHILTVVIGVILTGLVIGGIHAKKKKIIFGLGLDSSLMLLCFIIGMRLLYQLR